MYRVVLKTIRRSDLMRIGLEAAAEQIRERLDDLPVYLSVDIDVLDPAPDTQTAALRCL